MEELPLEILEAIYGYLGVFDRLAASSVCKQWYYASLNINVWKDAVIRINTENTSEGLNVLMNSERPFSCVVFEDCFKICDDASKVCSTLLFSHSMEMYRAVGQRLSVLQLKNCSVSGFYLTQILLECPNLQHLSAINCDNLFSSEKWLAEPEEINRLKSSLQNVKELDLSCNRYLSDMFFTRLAQVFTNVKSLSLAKCPINFSIFVFRRFYRSSDIKPSDNILNFFGIAEFIRRNAMRITSVNFDETAIDDTALKELACMEGLKLEFISFSRCCQVTAGGVREFCQYQKKLKTLILPVSFGLDRVLPGICANLFELRELTLGRSWPPDKVPSLLALELHRLSKLVKLDLNSCCEIVVLKFIDSLRNEAFPALRHLTLYKCMVDDYVFIYTIPYLLNVTHLNLSGTLITDKSLIMISTHLVRLRALQLSQCDAVTDLGLTGHLKAGPELFTVGGDKMENTGAMSVGNREFLKWLVFDEDNPVSLSNLKGLKELNIYDISGVSDDGIKVALVFKELRYLYIGGSSKITDEGLLAIGKNNSSLEVLSLRNSVEVTGNGIAKTLSCLPRLRLLDVQGCKNLTSSALSGLVKGHSFKLKYMF